MPVRPPEFDPLNKNSESYKAIMDVKNTVDSDTDSNGTTGGIGLRNVKRQLDLLYAGHYKLHTGRVDGFFIAELEIDLAELSRV